MLTRREAYPRYDRDVPDLVIPEGGHHIWDWYAQVSLRIGRVRDGICDPIPPSEWLAWQTLTGEIVHPWEHAILAAMDIAFCAEMNKELEAKRAEHHDEMQQKGKGKK
jgi:hypothetical protein